MGTEDSAAKSWEAESRVIVNKNNIGLKKLFLFILRLSAIFEFYVRGGRDFLHKKFIFSREFPLEPKFGGEENLYSEAGFPPLQTSPPFQHRLGFPPKNPAG